MAIKLCLSISTILFIPIPIFTKVLLIEFLFDGCDNNLIHSLQPLRIGHDLNTYYAYQLTDKLSDHLISLVLLLFIYNHSFFTPSIRLFLLFLYIYRTIGVFMYFQTLNRREILLFPNFYLYAVFSISLSFSYPSIFPFYPTLFLFMILKFIQEYQLYKHDRIELQKQYNRLNS